MMRAPLPLLAFALILAGCGADPRQPAASPENPQASEWAPVTAEVSPISEVASPTPSSTTPIPKSIGKISAVLETDDGYSGTLGADLYAPQILPLAEFSGCGDTTNLRAWYGLNNAANLWVKTYRVDEESVDTSPASFPWDLTISWGARKSSSLSNDWLYCAEGGAADLGIPNATIGRSLTYYIIAISEATPKDPRGNFHRFPSLELRPLGPVTSCKPSHCEFSIE